MNWSWEDLIYRSVLPFGKPGEGMYDQARKYLIEAQEDFILVTKCLDRWKWLYIAADTAIVTLPDDFIDLIRAEWNGQKMGPTTAQYMEAHLKADENYQKGTPRKYYKKGLKLMIHPAASAANWLALWYVNRPNVLDDDATAYSKLSYDALTAHFVKGETVTGTDSTETGVVEYDDNNIKAGTLILSSVSGTFTNNEVLTGSVNGVAVADGVDAVFSTAGDFPDIDVNYRKYLVDYAKQMMFDDEGNDARAEYHRLKYEGHRDMIEVEFAGRLSPMHEEVLDVMYGPIQ